MPAMITGKKTRRYSTEFKVKAVEWSYQTHRSVKGVAEAQDIHPFLLSRWRKEYREGKFAMKRVKKAPAEAKQKIQEQDEIARLKRQIAELQEENDILSEVFSVVESQRLHAEAIAWLEAALSEPCSVKFGRGHLMWLNNPQCCP